MSTVVDLFGTVNTPRCSCQMERYNIDVQIDGSNLVLVDVRPLLCPLPPSRPLEVRPLARTYISTRFHSVKDARAEALPLNHSVPLPRSMQVLQSRPPGPSPGGRTSLFGVSHVRRSHRGAVGRRRLRRSLCVEPGAFRSHRRAPPGRPGAAERLRPRPLQVTRGGSRGGGGGGGSAGIG